MRASTVQITKATRPTYWYARLSGVIYEVYPGDKDSYVLKEDKDRGGFPIHHILRADCELCAEPSDIEHDGEET